MNTSRFLPALLLLLLGYAPSGRTEPRTGPCSIEQAKAWRQREGWRIGCNYLPSTAINQHEMWHSGTWDPATIASEIELASKTGLNTFRVYLHDRTFNDNPEGFLARMDEFIGTCSANGIKPIFVFFDSCWLCPAQVPDLIPAPRPGTHNSGWLQSPGATAVRGYAGNPELQDRLRVYVQTVLRRFGEDERVLAWDLFNEPGNRAHRRFDDAGAEIPGEQREPATPDGDLALLRDAFKWAWEVNPSQPLTSGVWTWFRAEDHAIAKEQLQSSDIITFHCYSNLEGVKKVLETVRAQADGRPVICTEYMARKAGSTFEAVLPYLAAEDIGAIHWGFVDGKSQTRYSWASWKTPETEDSPWFHDLYLRDGTPYRAEEVELLRKISAGKKASAR